MDPQFWLDRWSEGRTGFHRDDVHPDLLAHAEAFLGDGRWRVLVPLCGKSVDLAWLVGQGHEVVGIDLAPEAAAAVLGDAPAEPHGPLQRRRRGSLTHLCGDLLAASPELLGSFDRIWDRAALVALDPPRRRPYAALLRALLPSGGRILLNTFAYDQSRMEGPPFSVEEPEIRALYPDLSIDLLARDDEALEEKFRERGLDAWVTSTWLLRAP